MAKHSYYAVEIHVYSFETKEEAGAFQDRFMNVFCRMEETKELGSSWRVIEDSYEVAEDEV